MRGPARNVLGAVINVNDFGPAFAGHPLKGVIDGCMRFQSLHFVGQDVAVEVFEEREFPADVLCLLYTSPSPRD